MLIEQLRAAAAMPQKLALAQLQRLVKSQAKLLHTTALLESGVAGAIRDWRSLDELRELTGSTRPDYLVQVLELGVSLGSIESRGGRYRAKSRLLKAVSAKDGGPIAAFLREFAHYHGQLLRELPAQIAGGDPPDYLAEYGELVAGASKIVEPFLEAYIDDLAGGTAPLRILEIGCGSGIYLRRYARCNPKHHGVAIDFDPAVVAQARDNVKRWSLDDRFDVLEADARSPGPELDGPFDLITSFQNVYYFDDRERLELFRAMHSRLAPGGSFALVSAMSGKGFLFRYYDVILNGSAGCHSLPREEAVRSDLRSAGFRAVEQARLFSGPGVVALRAHPADTAPGS